MLFGVIVCVGGRELDISHDIDPPVREALTKEFKKTNAKLRTMEEKIEYARAHLDKINEYSRNRGECADSYSGVLDFSPSSIQDRNREDIVPTFLL